MKKTLLLGASIALGVTGFAQNAKKAPVALKPTSILEERCRIEPVNPIKSDFSHNLNSRIGRSNSTNAACATTKFTSAPNAFAVGGGTQTFTQNCLTYNADLNAVLWTTRVSSNWNFTGKTSGAQQATWLNVTAGTWDSCITWKNPADNHGGRYPSGSFLNPSGNTSISNAYAVGSGPVTDGANWAGTWYTARSLGGNYHAIPGLTDSLYTNKGTAPFGNVGDFTNYGYLNYDAQQVGNRVLTAGPLYDASTTGTNVNNVHGMVIASASLTGTGVHGVSWSADSSIKPSFYKGTLGFVNNGQARIAFGLDNQTGYAVFLGRLATNYGNKADSTISPVVYKTTDGGTSWTGPLLPGYDWYCKHPEVAKNVGDYLYNGGTGGLIDIAEYNNYAFDASLGADLTVDANGVLHFVCGVTTPFREHGSTSIDSMGVYSFTEDYDYISNRPIFWDFMTDGTTAYGWKTLMVDSLISGDIKTGDGTSTGDSTSLLSPFSDGQGGYLGVTAHLTVSRSTDGHAIFYGWCDSYPGTTGSLSNIAPDIFVKGYDVTTGKVTASITKTNGGNNSAGCFFPYISSTSYKDASNNWVVPAVYAQGRGAAPWDGTQPVDYYYTNCYTFAASDFSINATVNSANTGACPVRGIVGIQKINAFESSISNYPNPFNGTTNIVVKLSESKNIDVKVYDAIGNVVFSKNTMGTYGANTIVFDGSNLSAGMYYYTVTAGAEKATKKMVIQK